MIGIETLRGRWGILFTAVCLGGGLVFTACTFTNPSSGGQTCGTQIGDPDEGVAVKGCVEDENDNPVAEARVDVFYTGALAKQAAGLTSDTTDRDSEHHLVIYTKNNGFYSIPNGLHAGNYDIDILIQSKVSDSLNGDSLKPLAALKTGVHVNAGGHLSFRHQTLLPRGHLSGTVFDKWGPMAGATCTDAAARFMATTDESGLFTMFLPEGVYSLTCIHSPQGRVTMESVQVKSNQETKVDQITLGDVGNIVPAHMSAKYDSVTGMVHLSWAKTDFTGFFSYELRRIDTRKYPDSTGIRTNDTAYDDLVYRDRSDKDSTKLYYTVMVKTGTRTQNLAQSDLIIVGPPKIVGPDIELGYARKGSNPPELDSLPAPLYTAPLDSVFTLGDTARFFAKYLNHFRANTKLSWVAKRAYDDTFAWIEDTSKIRADLRELSGTDSFNYPCSQAGKIRVSLTIEDEMGTTNTVMLHFEIVKPPSP